MAKPFAGKLILLFIVLIGLAACGGGGGSAPPSAPGSTGITGGGVKGPLANAIVTVYAFDATQPGFKGAVVATASTDAAAAITGLALPFPVSPPYIMEFTSDVGTTDITTGLAPVIGAMRTVITQALLDTGQQIYATPLTTMAVDIAVANSTTTTTAAEFETALAAAATQVVSTVGFGMSGDIDIFDVPPLVDNTTDTSTEQADVAAYRSAVEALTAVVFQMEAQSSGSSVDAVLSELSLDLADGVIDGTIATVPSTVFTSTTLDLLAQDPATLPIPNLPGQTVADVQAILVSETATTGTTTTTTALDTGGSITTTTTPAEPNPDTDGDGVLNADDAFPEDPLETVDTDGDGIGDNADPDADGNGILDADEAIPPVPPTATDADGDGFDDVTADNCPATFNPTQTNTDGNAFPDPGDACDTDDDDDGALDTVDLFPLNAGEQSDADGDGTGDNADTDDDNDGLLDTAENLAIADPDGDGIPNREDIDSDGDGFLDSVDLAPYNAAITINNAPVAGNATPSVDEDNALPVTLLAPDDIDAPGALSWAITSAPANGALTGTAPALTYTPNANFNGSDSLSFTATDSSGAISNVATINITVNAVNDAPVVDAVGPFGIAENVANGATVGTVTATDVDSTVTGFSITAGNPGNAFAIAANGAITVADTTAIDFETSTVFNLTVTATDGLDISAGQAVVIDISDVNDTAPVVDAVGPFGIAENVANSTIVGTVTATDADSTITGFSITAGDPVGAFIISSTGVITVADTTAIDFETSTSFTLSVTATDGINTSAGQAVTINISDVNDTAPVVDAVGPFGVAENVANSTIVGIVTATDADSTIAGYSITAGDPGGAFAISSTGVITVADTTAIDFETSTSFTLTVTATDGAITSAGQAVTINISDVNDNAPIVDAVGPFGIAENAVNGSAVGTVTATDVDSTVTGFSITAGNTGTAFAIAANGAITVADTTAIDFETSTSFTLTVTATDGAITSAGQAVTINISDVNDTAPIVDAVGPFGIAENAVNGAAVGTVTATDVDSTVTSYSITAGNTGAAYAIAANGAITVADTTAIDFETSTSFTLTVTATDGVNTSAGQAVTINISDVNDTAPVVGAAQSFALAENSGNFTTVGTVTATDVDSTVTGFSIIAGNPGTAFAIAASGVISVANSTVLDYEANTSFTLSITATDGANTSIAQDVVINLTDLNDNAPVITAGQSFGVGSTAANGAVVGTVIATDADTTPVTGFTILTGNTGAAFAIAANGQITVANNANLLANSPYSLNIIATDGVFNSAGQTVGITVNTGGAVWDNFDWDDGSTWQ